MPLPDAFLTRPIAHRALHDRAAGRPENSIEAIRAAVEAGYGIEIDLQMSQDGAAIVFHDYDLERLTGEKGPIQMRPAAQLTRIPLIGGTSPIPTFAQVLEEVGGKAPLLVEIKDQDGALGPAIGRLEQAAATALQGYRGDVAVMSFNPNSARVFGGLAPDIPCGLTSCAFTEQDWPLVPKARRERLANIPDIAASRAQFISHDQADLQSPHVTRLKSRGLPILCWTIRTPEAEAQARRIADNVTFEGYLPPILT
jgi:glycerophosphoryl diester phosphodiesterase